MTKLRWITVMLGASLALVLGSGCDDDSTSSSSSSGGAGAKDPPKPCELLTREEAAAAAKNPVKDGKTLGVVCVWEPENVGDETHLQVSAAYVKFADGADPKEACEQGLAGIPSSKPFPGGPGDAAYWDYQEGGLGNAGNLHVCLSHGFVDTSAIGERPEAELQQIAVSLANTVIGRL